MNKKQSTEKILILASLLLILISFLLNKNTMIRLFFCLISIIIITLLKTKDKKNKVKYVPLYFTLYFIILLTFDTAAILLFKRIPIFSYNIITNNDTVVYNTIGLRVWQCDKNNTKNIKVEPFYEKGFTCDIADMDAIDSNSFLNSIVENYDSYKNNFIKINGKISKKNGQNYIEMQPYEQDSITINGYVKFATNITLKIIFETPEPELDQYDVYDKITVVGVIKNLEYQNNKYTIYMYESEVASTIDLSSYKINVLSQNDCANEKEIIYSNDNTSLYSYCLNEVTVTFPQNNAYELSFALSSNKLQVNNIYENSLKTETNANNDTLYQMNSYNVLVCNPTKNNQIIIGNNQLDFSLNLCD